MAENILGNLSLRPERELPPDRVEPRLFPASRTRPLEPAAPFAEEVSRVGVDGRVSSASPTISAPDRLTPGRAEPSPGTLLSLALVGLVATAIIGAFFSIGLLLLSGPAKQTIAASEPVSARPPAPRPAGTGTPHPATTSTAPLPSVVPHPAASEVKPPPQTKTVQAVAPPVPSSSPSPTAVPPPKPASIGAVPPVAARDAGAPPSPLLPQKPAAYHAAGHPPPRHLQSEHTRTAARAPHLRSAHDGASPALRQARTARSMTPPPDQTRSFDQLVSQLTGQTKPADQDPPTRRAQSAGPFQGQTLTPPPPDQPDPFAGR
jgi:hypothetical protein